MVVARGYIRVSTDEQAMHGYSLAAQRERLEAVVKMEGWAVGDWYVDDGVSAKDTKRPEFQRMLKEAQPGDVILVYKLDRLTRSVRDLDYLLRLFDEKQIHFSSATEKFDTTTATGRLMMRLVGELAQWERELIAERSAMGKKQKATSGEWPGGPIPLGYAAIESDKVGKGGKRLLRLVPDEKTSSLIPQVFERYLSGYGVRAVCHWLNDEVGARSINGKRFTVPSLTRVLTNAMYCGDIVHGRRVKNSEVSRVAGSHEPLISRETFEAVQAMFDERKTYAPRQATGVYILAGVARCGVCGGRVDVIRSRRKSDWYVRYRCHSYAVGGKCWEVDTPLSGVPADVVEENVKRAILDFKRTERLQEYFDTLDAEVAKETGIGTLEVKRLQSDLAESEATIERWKSAFEARKIEIDEYTDNTRSHRERVKAMKARLDEYKTKKPATPALESIQAFVADFEEGWDHLTKPEQKALLQHLRRLRLEIRVFQDRHVELVPVV